MAWLDDDACWRAAGRRLAAWSGAARVHRTGRQQIAGEHSGLDGVAGTLRLLADASENSTSQFYAELQLSGTERERVVKAALAQNDRARACEQRMIALGDRLKGVDVARVQAMSEQELIRCRVASLQAADALLADRRNRCAGGGSIRPSLTMTGQLFVNPNGATLKAPLQGSQNILDWACAGDYIISGNPTVSLTGELYASGATGQVQNYIDHSGQIVYGPRGGAAREQQYCSVSLRSIETNVTALRTTGTICGWGINQ